MYVRTSGTLPSAPDRKISRALCIVGMLFMWWPSCITTLLSLTAARILLASSSFTHQPFST